MLVILTIYTISITSKQGLIMKFNKERILREIEICKEAAKNNFDICCETYIEITSKLDMIMYLLTNDKDD